MHILSRLGVPPPSLRTGLAPAHILLHNALEREIAMGAIQPGERLPTAEAIATHTKLAINTVSRAMTMLRRAGITSAESSNGTVVVDPAPARRSVAQREISSAIRSAKSLRLDREQIEELLADVLTQWYDRA